MQDKVREYLNDCEHQKELAEARYRYRVLEYAGLLESKKDYIEVTREEYEYYKATDNNLTKYSDWKYYVLKKLPVEMSDEEFAAVEKQIPESILTKLKQSSPIPTTKLIEEKEKDWVVILLTAAAGIITFGGLILAIMAGRLPTNIYINNVQQVDFSFSLFLSTLLPYILYGASCLFLAEVCKKAGAALKMFGKK